MMSPVVIFVTFTVTHWDKHFLKQYRDIIVDSLIIAEKIVFVPNEE